uniref:BAALC binder of MAP3K1 and KLF4 b n=1 Tax=Myripristis murdjan TaxID=586833 RepID=A0A667X012_9TELE
MGCGGSRADAIIEPRYHESWTRETESTWLTNTDSEGEEDGEHGDPVWETGPHHHQLQPPEKTKTLLQ